MTESSTRNYKKILTISAMIYGAAFIPIFIVAYWIGTVFEFMAMLIAVIVSQIGYLGGLWLWEYLATSELINENLKRSIKIVGIMALISLGCFTGFNLYIIAIRSLWLMNLIVWIVSYVMLFMFCYCIGYLLSIWKEVPTTELVTLESESKKPFRIDWRITRRVLKIAIPLAVIFGVIFLSIGGSQGIQQFIDSFIYYGIFLIFYWGFWLGYLIWEHLKRSNLIMGEFQEQLKWISVFVTLVLGILSFYGFIVIIYLPFKILLLRNLIIMYSIVLILMFFYFLGLFISIVKANPSSSKIWNNSNLIAGGIS